jgi:CRISPR-associated protein (TIGR03984 family)
LEGAIALLYSPDSCKFLRLLNSEFEYASTKEREQHRLSSVFEARIFTPECELRWLNRENGKGDAVLLTESPQPISEFEEDKEEIEDTLPQHYLLWGEPVLEPKNIQDGWQRLAEARIGKLNIPISEKLNNKNQRVYLKTREYISALEYGNCAVIEERLLKLEVK